MKNFSLLSFCVVLFFTSCDIGDDIINDYQEPSITIVEKNSGVPIPSELTISKSYDFSEVYSIKYLNDVGELKNELITWESSNPSVITINNQGLATAVSSGKATISVSATNDNPNGENTKITKEIATITVTSVPEVLTVTNAITILSIGEKFTFKTTYFNNAGKEDNTVSLVWESTTPEVASISNTGEITGKSEGTTEIIVKTATNSIATTFMIKVSENISIIRINNPLVESLRIGKTHQYEYSYFDENGNENTSNTILWESSNTAIATINNGLVTAISPGSTTIRATTIVNEKTIRSVPTSVTISNNTLSINDISSLNIGSTHQYTVNFEGTTPITWSSSDTSVATITSSGLVTAIAAGDTTITATTVEGGETIMDTTNLEIKGVDSKSGTLETISYSVRGEVTLTSTMMTITNFNSTAPDTHVYLTNNPNRNQNDSSDYHVTTNGKITSSALVTIALDNIDINTYSHVVITCRSFGNFIMGKAELK